MTPLIRDQVGYDLGPESTNEIKSLFALEQVFGGDILSVRVIGDSAKARLSGVYATTRVNTIYVNDTVENFFTYDFTVLEEYYHVLRQWNPGRMTRTSYMLESLKNGYDNNKFEIEAKGFASDNVGSYKRLKRN